MAITYWLGFLWAAALLFALWGWGELVRYVLRGPRLGIATTSCVGLAALLLLGGVLNYVRAISPLVAVALVVAGVLLLMLCWGRSAPQEISPAPGWAPRLILLLAVGILAFRVLAAGQAAPGFDDRAAYYLFPERMLREGSLGFDPFSERRCANALGGMSFLQALLLAPGLGLERIDLVEGGIGLILAFLIAGEVLTALRAPALLRALVLLAIATQRAYDQYNSTAYLLGSALFMGVAALLLRSREDPPDLRLEFLALAVCAALCVLKSNFIPAAGLLGLGMVLVPPAWQGLGAYLRRGLWLSLPVLAILAPWMADMYRSAGTPLYPFFGPGYHGLPYTSFPSMTIDLVPSRMLAMVRRWNIPLLIAGVALLRILRRKPSRAADPQHTSMLLFLVSLVLGGFATNLAAGGIGAIRYGFPMFVPACLLGGAYLWLARPRSSAVPARVAAVGLTLLAIIALVGPLFVRGNPLLLYQAAATRLGEAWRGVTITSTAEHAAARQLQDAVPAGARLLVHCRDAQRFDLRRNQVLLIDCPGMLWPAPGTPEGQDAAGLRRYLLGHGIRYVAFSHADRCGYDAARAANPKVDRWERALYRYALDFQEKLRALQPAYLLYDDGQACVLDLAGPT